MKSTSLIIALLLVVTVGMFAMFPAAACERQDPSDHEQALLAQAVVQAGFAAMALRKIEEGDIEKAQQLLQFQLAMGLTKAGEFSNIAPPPETATAELLEALRRARSYVQDHSLNPELVVAADKAINHFNQTSSP